MSPLKSPYIKPSWPMFQSPSIDFSLKVIWRSLYDPRDDLELETDVAIEIAIQETHHDQRYKALVSILVSRSFKRQAMTLGWPWHRNRCRHWNRHTGKPPWPTLQSCTIDFSFKVIWRSGDDLGVTPTLTKTVPLRSPCQITSQPLTLASWYAYFRSYMSKW